MRHLSRTPVSRPRSTQELEGPRELHPSLPLRSFRGVVRCLFRRKGLGRSRPSGGSDGILGAIMAPETYPLPAAWGTL
jgi:hypothetical protein